MSVHPSEAANAAMSSQTCLMNGLVADDAALGMFPLRLELRLDQREQMHRCGGERQRNRQHGLQRDEADIDDDDVGPRRQPLALEGADIGTFHRNDVGMVPQRGMQLPVPDVDREHDGSAVGEQDFGEAAGRRADVEADMALDVDRVLLQRARELDAAAGDVGVRGLRLQHGVSWGSSRTVWRPACRWRRRGRPRSRRARGPGSRTSRVRPAQHLHACGKRTCCRPIVG